MRQTRETIKSWISDVNGEGRGLTKWELSFMENITERFESGCCLSDRQEELLESIRAEKTP